ncbi:MAG: hypothetical protein LBH91_08820 [Prevotellaceae bacterium]|jgi:hypothetical protein|nr:hypothetical protein [Prevotellaceae bacterium]
MNIILKIQLLIAMILSSTGYIFAQNVERKVLYTLGEDEKLDETKFSFQTEQAKYYCITSLKELTFKNRNEFSKLIVNNQIVSTGLRVDDCNDVIMFNKNIANYKYTKARTAEHTFFPVDESNIKDMYLVLNGEEYGPYEDVKNCGQIIVFKQSGQYFALLPDERIVGPYNAKDARDITIIYDDLSGNYITTVYESNPSLGTKVYYNENYLYKNHNTNEQFSGFISNKKGDSFFTEHQHNGETYFNGQAIGKTSSCKLSDEGCNAYIYYDEEQNRTLLTVNQVDIFDGYDGIQGLDINNKGGSIYRYSYYGNDYVNINGNINGAYDNIADYDASFAHPSINDKNDYIYAYRTNGEFYVSFNGKTEGPYDETWRPYLDKNGNYIYRCLIKGKQHIVKNGKKGKAFDYVSLPYMTKNGHYIFGFKKGKKIYLNINGRIEEAYNIKGNIIENLNEKGQYAYTYSKDGIKYVCVNGKNYKEPVPGGEWQVKEDIQDGFKAEYSVQLGGDNHFSNYEKLYYNQAGEIIYGEFHNNISYQKILKSKDEKTIMIYDNNPYIMINNQQYGNGEILAAGYNQKLNIFRWSMLEGKELVLYEYKCY